MRNQDRVGGFKNLFNTKSLQFLAIMAGAMALVGIIYGASGLDFGVILGFGVTATITSFAAAAYLMQSGSSDSVVEERDKYKQIFESIPTNVMLADKNGIITELNAASEKTLKEIEHLLPIKVNQIKGRSYDVFHANPAHQKNLLADPRNLPHQAIIEVGEEKLDLLVSPLYDTNDEFAGPIVTWSVVTEKLRAEEEANQYKQMVDNIPINILLADLEGKVINMNPSSEKTLKSIQHLLPVPVDQIVGGSYDVFHKDPSHQRKLLADPRNLPHETMIQVGEEQLDLLVTALYDNNGKYTGPMVTWAVVTERERAKTREEEVKKELESTISTLSSSFTQLSSNSNELSSNTLQISGSSEDVQKYINSVSVAVEELVSSIAEISKNTDSAANMTQDSVAKIEGTESIIQSLRDRSEEIASILKVVTEIANQTNLLALNATIEAARAGEAGKGFAVVANEVKELANRTAEATDDINKKIAAIQVESQSALDSISTASESVRSINEVAISIAGSVEEQTAVTSEIGKSMKSSTDKVEEMAGGVRSVGSLVENNSEMTKNIEDVTHRLEALAKRT